MSEVHQQARNKNSTAEWSALLSVPEAINSVAGILDDSMRSQVSNTLVRIKGNISNREFHEATQTAQELVKRIADQIFNRVSEKISQYPDISLPVRWPIEDSVRNYDCKETSDLTYRFVSHVPFLLDLIPPEPKSEFLEMARLMSNGIMPKPEDCKVVRDAMAFDRGEDLDPTSGLTWMMFACAYSTYSEGLAPINMLKNLSRFINDSCDESKRLSIAHAELSAIRESYSGYTEFGPEVPVRIVSKLDVREWQHDLGPFLFGHEIALYYVEKDAAYHLFSARKELPLNDFNFFEAKMGKGENLSHLHNSRKAILTDRKEVSDAIAHIKEKGFSLGNQPPLETKGELPFGDLYDRRSKRRFFGEFARHPVSVINTFKGQTGPMMEGSVHPQRGDIAWLRHKLTFKCEQAGPHVKIQGSEDKASIQIAFKKPVKGGRDADVSSKSFGKLKEVRVLAFNEGRALILFPEPINIPEYAISGKAPSKKIATKFLKVYGVQNYTPGEPLSLLTERPTLEVADKRFNKSPITFSFNSKIPVNQAFNRHALQFCYDPMIAKLGFRSNSSGANALSNLWHISFPLEKPSPEQFAMPELAPIRGLMEVPRESWGSLLRAIEGDDLDSVRIVPVIGRDTDSTETRNRQATDKELETATTGKFYKAPREAITLVGRWVISHCKQDNIPYFIVDSPMYGDALWVFRSFPTALSAAKHFVSKSGTRIQATWFPDFVKRIPHTEHWEANLKECIEQQIIKPSNRN